MGPKQNTLAGPPWMFTISYISSMILVCVLLIHSCPGYVTPTSIHLFCSGCIHGQGNFTPLQSCNMEAIQERRMSQMGTSIGGLTTWIVLVLSTTQTTGMMNFNIVTIGKTEGPSYVSDTSYVDCKQAAALNLTINITSIGVESGDTYFLYQQVHQLPKNELEFLFIDQSVASPDLLHGLLTTSRIRYSNVTTITLQRYENDPAQWCCLTDRWFNKVTGEDDSSYTDVEPDPYSFYWSDTLSLDVWSRRSRLQAKVMIDIVNSEGWSEIMVIYEHDYEKQVRVLLDLASESNVQFRLVDFEDGVLESNIKGFFEDSDTFHALIISKVEAAKKVMELALGLEKSLGKSVPVTSSSRWLLFAQDGLIEPTSWIRDTRFDNIAIVCDPYDLSPRIGLKWEYDDILTITTLMYTTRTTRALSTVGSVGPSWDVRLHAPIFPNIEFGFNGRLFLITTNTWDPYVYKRFVNGTPEYYGFCMDMATELARTLNFTIQWTEPPDGEWGQATPNGTWTGMVGQVQREEVDMIIAPIGVTGAREKVIDFTFAFFYDDTAVIMKKPDPEKSKWRTYIDIFKEEVLLCIGASLVLGSFFVYLIEYMAKKVYEPCPKTFAVTYSGCVWYLLGAMTNQGGRHLPISLSGRMFLSSWWLFCLVIVGTYSGNLIAVLTVTKDKPPFNTLAEMASQDEYKFGTLGNSMWTTLFETSPRPEFQALNRRIKTFASDDPDVVHLSADVHLKKVKRGGYAYIADKGLFTTWLATNCDLMLLKETFYPAKYAIGMPNQSVYTKRISDQVAKIYESGLLQIWIQRWWPKRSFCSGSLLTEAKTLTLVDVQSSFYLIGIGSVLGGLFLLCEGFVKKFLPDFYADFCNRYSQKK